MDNCYNKHKGVIMHHTEMLDNKFYIIDETQKAFSETSKNALPDQIDYQPIHSMNQKILHHSSALACWHKNGIPDPICTELHPTNKCNNICTFCHFKNLHAEPKSLSLNHLISIITQLKENNCQAIIFSGGGEPLMNQNTIPAIKYAKSLGMEVAIITNGQLIDANTAKELLNVCTWIRVSLSATTKQNFIKIRGVDKFDDALEGITQLCLNKAEINSSCTIGVQWINTQLETTTELATFIEQWLSKRPIDYLQIIPEQSYDIRKLLKQSNLKQTVYELQNKFYGRVNIISSKTEDLVRSKFGRNYDQCYGHNFVPMIAADFKMYLCCHLLGQEKALIGDLNEDSFMQVWYSRKRQEIARKLNIEKCMPLCKHHEINKFLHTIKQPMLHENFL
jgi:MoaA/NifB/PqqE/SkfB family radical SAM enzyme